MSSSRAACCESSSITDSTRTRLVRRGAGAGLLEPLEQLVHLAVVAFQDRDGIQAARPGRTLAAARARFVARFTVVPPPALLSRRASTPTSSLASPSSPPSRGSLRRGHVSFRRCHGGWLPRVPKSETNYSALFRAQNTPGICSPATPHSPR